MSDLIGMRVITSNGEDVGVVDDFKIDASIWRLTHLIIKPEDRLAREFSLKGLLGRTKPVPLEARLVSSVRDVIMLSVTSGELRKALRAQLMGGPG